MCGIAGIISKREDFSFTLYQMSLALKHRGEDDQGVFVDKDKGVYLSHNRLSVMDLSSNARQPFYNEDRSIVSITNGEIYNFRELKNELTQKGHQFYSRSDNEVIVHAFEEWKEGFPEHLEGMFALAIFDKRNHHLVLARDPLGVKPLYYLKESGAFVFASELKAFLSLPKNFFNPQIDREALERLLFFPFIPDDDLTAWKGVVKVPPGHLLTLDSDQVSLKKYWELKPGPERQAISFNKAVDVLEEKLLNTTDRYLQSDVKAGIFLSGGVDSSLIAALATKIRKEPIDTLTIGFSGLAQERRDERDFAAKVADALGSRHAFFEINVKEIGKKIEDILVYLDDLSSVDAGFVSTYLLAQRAKEAGIKVALVGEGADEVFGGYPWFSLARFPFNSLPPALIHKIYYRRIAKNFSYPKAHEGEAAFNRLIGDFKEKDVFRRISGFEIRYQLPNNFLMRIDKATMAHGIEARVPYLDKGLVEFVYNLPAGYKSSGRFNKFILRQVAGRYLPLEVAQRAKRGFLFPAGDFLADNREKVGDYLLEKNSFARTVFSKEVIEKWLNTKSFAPFWAKEAEAFLWKLFAIEVWKTRFCGNLRDNPLSGRLLSPSLSLAP